MRVLTVGAALAGDRQRMQRRGTRRRVAPGAVLLATVVGTFVPIVVFAPPATAAAPPEQTVCNFAGGCEGSDPPLPRPPGGCGEECIEGLHPKVTIVGRVLNREGAPVEGADVWWQYGMVQSATGGSNPGSFSITVWADAAVNLYAKHPRYVWGQMNVQNPVLASAPTAVNEFSLAYLLSTEVSPGTFTSVPKTLTFTTLSTAPRNTEVGLVHFADGSTVVLDYDATSAAGVSRYLATWTLPAGSPEAWYQFRSCIVSDGAPGATCDTAGALLSEVAHGQFVFDATPPVLLRTSPERFQTVLGPPSLGVWLRDAVSGINPGSVEMRLDGQAVTVVDFRAWMTDYFGTSGVTVGDGVHRVEIQAADYAGNGTTDAFLFTRAQLTATATNAALLPAQVTVTPTGPVSGKAVFSGVQVGVGGFSESLSASTRVGTGDLERAISLGQVTVVFNNGTPVEQEVTISAPTTTARHSIAVLGPSGTALTSPVPPSVTTLPSFDVPAPVGYGGSGATARLVPKTVSVSGPLTVPNGEILLARALDDEVLVTGEIGACLSHVDPVRLNCFKRDDAQGVIEFIVRGVAGQGIVLNQASIGNPLDDDPESFLVECRNTGTSSGCTRSFEPDRQARLGLVFGCGRYSISGTAFNLCTGQPAADGTPPSDPYVPWNREDGYFSAWLNAAVYQALDGATDDGSAGPRWQPLWQQDHIDIDDSGDPCANDAGGVVTAGLYRASANGMASDGQTLTRLAGTLPTSGGRIDVYLGNRTGTLSGGSSSTSLPPDPDAWHQLSSTHRIAAGSYLSVIPRLSGHGLEPGEHQDGFGHSVDVSATGGAASNSWRAPGSDGFALAWDSGAQPVTGRVQLVSGLDFAKGTSYERAASLSFQFVADFSDCR